MGMGPGDVRAQAHLERGTATRLRYGKHVQVIEPADLRHAVISILDEARAAYKLPDRRPPQSAGFARPADPATAEKIFWNRLIL
jgi:hypothetical protein